MMLMLKRGQTWTEANPLWGWMLCVAVGLAVLLTLFFVIPGPKTPGLALLFVALALGSPTHALIGRLSGVRRETRPVPPPQERGVGLLVLMAFVCSVGAFGVCLLGTRVGWSTGREVGMLMASRISALLSLGLGYAARHTAAGR